MSLLSSVGLVSVYFASSWLCSEPCAPAANHGDDSRDRQDRNLHPYRKSGLH